MLYYKQHIMSISKSNDQIVIPPELPAVAQDLKDFCLQEAFNLIKRIKAGDRAAAPVNCMGYFYTIGYYNRAFYAEGKQLAIDDTGPLPFFSIYFNYFYPELENRKPKLLKSSNPDIKKISLNRELDCVYKFQNNFKLCKYILYNTLTNKHFIEDVLQKEIDLKDEQEIKSQLPQLEEIMPDIVKEVETFEKRILKLEDTLKNKVNKLGSSSASSSGSTSSLHKKNKKQQAIDEKFKSGKLDIKTNSLEIIKRAIENNNTDEFITTVAKNAYIVGYLDRALKMEDLKLKKVDMDKPFKDFMKTINDFLETSKEKNNE